jgi:dipeptidyl aminopeptidase/acylaminoacyl peptidase
MCRRGLPLFFIWGAAFVSVAQTGYQKPPQAVLEVLQAPDAPIASVNPARTHVLFLDEVRNPSIAELAKPMLRLAGLRIDPGNAGPKLTRYVRAATLQRIDGGAPVKIDVPAKAMLSGLNWSPDGRYFAVMNHTATALELWVGETATGRLKKIEKAVLNAALGDAINWMPDSRTLLVRLVPAGRGKLPEEPAAPTAPSIQESAGKAGATRTYQDMLRNPHDENVFEVIGQSQLALVAVASGTITPLGKPALITSQSPSPDGKHLLVSYVRRPFSYVLPVQNFPREIEVWSAAGKLESKLASLPLQERIPIGGVATGPRNVNWNPTEGAALYWTEALDGGNPREKVPHRDRVLIARAPFNAPPVELLKIEERVGRGLLWGARGNALVYTDENYRTRWVRTYLVDPRDPANKKLLNERNEQDRYRDAGAFLTQTLPTGQRVLAESGGYLFLKGSGAGPEGDRPFLDRLDPVTGKKERLFHCDADHYEDVEALLSEDGSRFLTRRESPTEPPNFFVRDSKGAMTALTRFTDPSPVLRRIERQLVKYKRADGVDLSFTLYLPPGYQKGTRLPTVVWAYPREYNDADTAGQVTGSAKRFTRIDGYSHLFFLLEGYAVLDGATIPIVGAPEEANNSYVEQLTASARAAIDKAVEMGVTDRDRVGVGGHSYGAFMTANLLAHTDLFRAGIARSGAYNRTLTPFGFQNERRTFWQARDIYLKMSPFMVADRIKEPILLIHGEADNNQGTFPIQSERMFMAIRGNGGAVRYVTLPHESHGYSAEESVQHTLYEMISWFNQHVKNAPPRLTGAN